MFPFCKVREELIHLRGELDTIFSEKQHKSWHQKWITSTTSLTPSSQNLSVEKASRCFNKVLVWFSKSTWNPLTYSRIRGAMSDISLVFSDIDNLSNYPFSLFTWLPSFLVMTTKRKTLKSSRRRWFDRLLFIATFCALSSESGRNEPWNAKLYISATWRIMGVVVFTVKQPPLEIKMFMSDFIPVPSVKFADFLPHYDRSS